jgi:hypothetical protein
MYGEQEFRRERSYAEAGNSAACCIELYFLYIGRDEVDSSSV